MAASPLEFVDYPVSHSLVMGIVWGLLVGGAYYFLRRYGRGGWVMGVLVVSHWFLDLPMHQPDLPLGPGTYSPRFGWGLWNSIPATLVIEFTIYAIGIGMYLRTTRARDRIGRWGLRTFIVVLAALYFMSTGPPPANEHALAWTALGLWLFIPFAWWVDKHRMSVTPAEITPRRPSTF